MARTNEPHWNGETNFPRSRLWNYGFRFRFQFTKSIFDKILIKRPKKPYFLSYQLWASFLPRPENVLKLSTRDALLHQSISPSFVSAPKTRCKLKALKTDGKVPWRDKLKLGRCPEDKFHYFSFKTVSNEAREARKSKWSVRLATIFFDAICSTRH